MPRAGAGQGGVWQAAPSTVINHAGWIEPHSRRFQNNLLPLLPLSQGLGVWHQGASGLGQPQLCVWGWEEAGWGPRACSCLRDTEPMVALDNGQALPTLGAPGTHAGPEGSLLPVARPGEPRGRQAVGPRGQGLGERCPCPGPGGEGATRPPPWASGNSEPPGLPLGRGPRPPLVTCASGEDFGSRGLRRGCRWRMAA